MRVDGRVLPPKARLAGGETLEISAPPPDDLEDVPQAIALDVVHEDDALLVIDKPAGLTVHPGAGNRDGTLLNALLHYDAALAQLPRAGIVHRLDKDTSGCLAAAKNDRAHRGLIQQFMEREVRKTYLAITDGIPKPVSGKVEGNMGRSRRDRKLHAMLATGGRHSLTLYRTLENYGAVALVECDLKTGRTHQARVHLAHLGSPVLCDRDYGGRESYTTEDQRRALAIFRHGGGDAGPPAPARVLLARQALHAWRLSFRHPIDGRQLAFEAPLPGDMAAVLEPFRVARRAMEG